jgi:hypothetical protein
MAFVSKPRVTVIWKDDDSTTGRGPIFDRKLDTEKEE